MFAVDWPIVANVDGVNRLKANPADDATKQKIFATNAERLLSL